MQGAGGEPNGKNLQAENQKLETPELRQFGGGTFQKILASTWSQHSHLKGALPIKLIRTPGFQNLTQLVKT